MKSNWGGFRSVIAAPIERFLAHRRALGCRFRTEEMALRLLDRFLVQREIKMIGEIQPELLEAFLASRPRARPRSYNHLLCTVRRLFDWLVVQGDLPYSPVRTRPRRENRTARAVPIQRRAGASFTCGCRSPARSAQSAHAGPHLPNHVCVVVRPGHAGRRGRAFARRRRGPQPPVARYTRHQVLQEPSSSVWTAHRTTLGRLSGAARPTLWTAERRGAGLFIRWPQGHQPDRNGPDSPSALR